MIRDWNPKEGMAFQGDVALISLPSNIIIDASDEIPPKDYQLILLEGELTGHHHSIEIVRSSAADKLMADALSGKIPLPTAHLYRDDKAVQELVKRNVLTRTDLIIGLLVVEIGPMVLRHQEHDGIRIPPGAYLVSRQVENAGAEERRVAD